MVYKEKFQGFDYVKHSETIHHAVKCGHCGRDVSAWETSRYYDTQSKFIYWIICPICSQGSVIDRDGVIYPSPKFGDDLKGLPVDIENAYNEARNCISVNAYSACTLICRKILMNVAVDKGDQEGKNFTQYIDYLKTSGHITSVMHDWVDKIREGGNESTHKIPPASKGKAENMLLFTIQLLRNIYEMKFIADQQMSTQNNQNS